MKKNKDGAPICETEEEFKRERTYYEKRLFWGVIFSMVAGWLPLGACLIHMYFQNFGWALFFCLLTLFTLKASPSLENLYAMAPIPPKKVGKK